jgi:radical SAM protein with 4Fe4S-binding SPASM domain
MLASSIGEKRVIGITKLLTGKASVSAAVRGGSRQAHLLQFSSAARPVVVWNMTARCNLECRHCYIESSPGTAGAELSASQARALIDDLSALGAPVMLFSGGEPLLREDVYDLAAYASRKGLRPGLSTNGTLITREVAARLEGAGFAYVGVSIDGAEPTHDRFRNRRGAFREALDGLANAAAAGLRTGVRFTLNRRNAADLAAVLDVVERERVGRFCMYHLVYAGRAAADDDVSPSQTRAAVEALIDRAVDWSRRGVDCEVLTTDNHADGVLVLRRVEETEPARAAEVRRLLEMAGGCSAGKKFACVGADGSVYPCQFWRHESAGSVRERSFGDVWNSRGGPLAALEDMQSHLSGRRCGACRYKAICGGCRIRALAATGDVWGDDPGCYLTDDEIGAA